MPSAVGTPEPQHPERTSRAMRLGHLGEALLIWAGICTLIFGAYAIVERLWLRALPSETLAVAHIVRGLVASLLATLATAAYLLRRVFPSLERSLSVPTQGETPDEAIAREDPVSWLVGLRWVAVCVAAAVVAFATLVSHRVPSQSAPYLWAGILALAAFNTILSILGSKRLASERALALQVAGDVVVLGWLTHHAGGVQNPFTGLFVFHAAIAAVIFEAPQARRVAVAITGFALGLTMVQATGLFPPGCLRDARGACPATTDWLFHAAAGAAVAVMVMGCALIIIALVHVLRVERARLADATAALAARAEDLALARAQVQRERERLQTIIDCMADAVLFVGPDGAVRLQNRAAQRFWPEQMDAHGALRACHPPETQRRLIEKVAAPEPLEVHPIFQVRDRSYEATYAPVSDTDGALQGVVMVARDVTERIETQRWRMQEERMAVVGKLAAALAHELNNPLGAIALFTQHAIAEIEPAHPLRDHLGTVLRNANLCKKIVRDLLEYARQRPPERRTVALKELLGDVVRTLEPHAQTSGIVIRRPENGNGDLRTYGDPDQLRQVLVNLGLNGIDAMVDGGVLTIELDSTDKGWVRIGVADTGIGIRPEEQERIFTAFHTTKPEGTGLGLTVARDLVSAHGGSIQVTSTPGQGSTFAVMLPPCDEGRFVEASL